MPRNSVFFFVLVLISGGIVIDRAVGFLPPLKSIRFLSLTVCVGILGVFIVANLPSLRAVNVRSYGWEKESVMGPLLRSLCRFDPEKTWIVKIDGFARSTSGPMNYYMNMGYNVRRAAKDETYDVYVVRENVPRPDLVYLNYTYFLDHHCSVLVNPAAFRDKSVIFQISPVSTVLSLP